MRSFLCSLKFPNVPRNAGNVKGDCFVVTLKSVLGLESLTNQVVENDV